jgi:signal transduction histidine kinase
VLFAETGRAGSVSEFLAMSIMTAIWYLAIVMLGINLGNRRRYLQAIIDRAHQLARERDQLARLAVAEERSRIAREMHDIVAHSVSVMIALSEGAARVTSVAPDDAADAMRRSAETGRTALAEMRRMLGALHSPDGQADLVPQPGVQDLPELVRGFVDAGLAVSLEVSGDATGDRGQDLAVYRVVQEGLTNVLRYAGTGARAKVTVMRQSDRTVVQVRDYGSPPGAPAPVAGIGSGRGLAGLAERARVFGGSIESGPVDPSAGGGWRLWAVLPVSADARETNEPRTESEDRR